MIKVAEIREPDYLVTVITQAFKDITTNEYLRNLSESFPKQKLLVSGAQLFNHKLPVFKNIKYFNTPSEFINILKKF